MGIERAIAFPTGMLHIEVSLSVISMECGQFGTLQEFKSLVQELPSKEHLRIRKNMALVLSKDLLIICGWFFFNVFFFYDQSLFMDYLLWADNL